jgi:hypothetical protein
MFCTDRTWSAPCANIVPGKAAVSSRKARGNRQSFCFNAFELVIGKQVIGASTEKFWSEDQSNNFTGSDSLPLLAPTSRIITHKTWAPRQAVFKFNASSW